MRGLSVASLPSHRRHFHCTAETRETDEVGSGGTGTADDYRKEELRKRFWDSLK